MESIINSIRDILRKEGVTGMDSINHCIVFIISRMLNKKLCKKFDINKKFIFKNITKDDNGEELGNQDLYNRIYNGTKECLIGQIMFKLGFRNIKFKLEGTHNLRLIYDKLKDFDAESLSTEYDLIGTIYELHLKSGTSNAMRDLGQYYTHRLAIQYMIELCDPQMKNGIIEKIVDPTMGTGGFLTMSIKYLNGKYKNKIDWHKNKDNIIGFDIDDNVKNMALLNIFLEIGELCTDTLIKQDTLHNDMKFTNDGTILEKADVILANEPMGLKNIIHASLCDRIKNMKIRGTKAEPLFLQLFMESLNDNGRCAVIVPDGMLFNESNLHCGTRKHLIENFNLHKVVSLNDDFFLNTGVKTSILFFSKDGNKTKKVDFCEIKLKNGEIEENSIIKVKYSKIKETNYSLFVNKYNATEIEKNEGIEYKKLGEVCEIKFGKRIKKHDAEIDVDYMGIKYPCYGGGDISFYMKEFNREGKNIVISRFGVSEKCVRIVKEKFWLNDSGFTVHSNNEKKLLTDYLGYYCYLALQSKILDISIGACQKNLQVDDFKNLEIPMPSLVIQEAIVERLNVLNENIEKSKQIVDEYHKIIKYYIECQTKNEKEEMVDDIFEMVVGKKTTKELNENGIYDFYNGSAESPVGKLPDYSFDNEKHYILLIKDGGAGQGKYGDKIGLGKAFYVNGKTAFTTSVVALINKNSNKFKTKYLYYYLSTIKNNLMDLAQYTTGLGHLTIGRLKKMSLKIPTKEKQKEIIKYCDNMSDMINKIKQQTKDNKDLMKHITDSYLEKEQKQ